tara:strand:+ start:433 stop:678 length:246 start_codon:yes stop_codon:yes gene_type:complete
MQFEGLRLFVNITGLQFKNCEKLFSGTHIDSNYITDLALKIKGIVVIKLVKVVLGDSRIFLQNINNALPGIVLVDQMDIVN